MDTSVPMWSSKRRASSVPTMVKSHFFQPLLPGFHDHLNIPAAFFKKHIEGRYESKTAKLRSNVSYRTWKLKLDGRRFTDGWKEFAMEHDFRVGDIVVFRHEGDLAFHVTGFGPSCCNLQYPSSRFDDNEIIGIQDPVSNDQIPSGSISRHKRVKMNSRTEAESPMNDTCFLAPVTASNLHADQLYLPRGFSKGLKCRSCEMVLMNENGRTWTVKLSHVKHDRVYIARGWTSFCRANGQEAGGFFIFKLIRNGTNPVIRLSPEEPASNIIHRNRSERKDKKTLSEKCSREDETGSGKCSCSKRKVKKKKTRSMWRVSSSSPMQNRFVTLTLTPYCVRTSKLRLPTNFTKVNGVEKPREIILQDKDGVKQPVNLLLDSKLGRMRLGQGWRDFCDANEIKTGESFVLEFIWEDSIPVLKFCNKIKTETKTPLIR